MVNGKMDEWVKNIYCCTLTNNDRHDSEEKLNLAKRCFYILMGDEVNRRIKSDEPKIDLNLKGLCRSLLPWGIDGLSG